MNENGWSFEFEDEIWVDLGALLGSGEIFEAVKGVVQAKLKRMRSGDVKCKSLEPGTFPWDELRTLKEENAHLRECMRIAGLHAFMRHAKPEEVSEHLRDVAKSWIEFEGGVRQVLENYTSLAAAHPNISGWWKRLHELLAGRK